MSTKIKKYTCWTIQFCGGGASYGLLEVLWRGYTHISMLIAGGVCFWLLVRIAKMSCGLFAKSLIGGLCITSVEFISGCIVNMWLGLSVWDYTDEPMSLYGQVCIRYALLWIALCLIIIPVCKLGFDFRKYIGRPNLFRGESEPPADEEYLETAKVVERLSAQ